MKRLHYWIGLAGVVTFLLTGQYMDRVHDHLRGMPEATRMLYRANHIYILLSAALNLALGVYLVQPRQTHRAILQNLASLLVLAAPWLLLFGFFTEPHMADLARPYTRAALYSVFGAAAALAYLGVSGSSGGS